MLTVYSYPNCGTCRKAKKWLDDHNLQYQEVHIVETPPTKADLADFHKKSGLPLRKFFNTSGQKYRQLGMKDKIKTATDDELLNWLASDGKLIKRPIITDNEHVTVGFKEETFNEVWG
ncbi:arsenate reductase family protein [Scopulibacillus cellulosilyticus]|uniref:Arsenate reductase family protein n=1 Tax=Scopulibacillus cellulosilyticus TaxID=2665665 RepID=A0ABW2PYA1_9BACL